MEVEEKWSLRDLYKMHEAMDIQEEIEEFMGEKAKRDAKRGT